MRVITLGTSLAGVLMAGHVAAAEAPAFEGYWTRNAAWCLNAGQPGEESPDWYGRDGLFGLEWSCDLDQLTPTGVGQSWALQMTCLDAGYEYKQSQIFLLTREDRLLILDEAGAQSNMVRCPQSEKVE